MVIKKQVLTKDPSLDVLAQRLGEELGVTMRTSPVYYFLDFLHFSDEQTISQILADVITEDCVSGVPFTYSWFIEVGFKSGVTDTLASTTQTVCNYVLNRELTIKSAMRYYLFDSLSRDQVECIAAKLANSLIHHVTCSQYDGLFFATHSSSSSPLTIDQYIHLSDACKERGLSFTPAELEVIERYLQQDKSRRHALGLVGMTDCELEMLAQTWSEHCKHRTFNACIHYSGQDGKYNVDSLFATYIKAATQKVNAPGCLSVFSDNAGIFVFDDKNALACKVETHNSPSAKVPVEGAVTGVGGLGRDLNGSGLGAKPIAYFDILCFPTPDLMDRPPGVLSPHEIITGVLQGIESAGNKVGVPTVNGSITFHESYLAKPLVYCGGLGIMPRYIRGKNSHMKKARPDDALVIVGGRVGKDGIHGATFSSTFLYQDVPSSVVQRGDPFTQKKVQDFLLEARDEGLYTSITDNGAGGLSCSVGEMAQESNGCIVHLEKVLTKYLGLQPWEIWLSESQERMTLAVPKENIVALFALAKKHTVEAVVVGEFTATGLCDVFYDTQQVCSLPLSLLHKECPQLVLDAEWREVVREEKKPLLVEDYTPALEQLLAYPTIASKEHVVRRFDHEVQGHTVGKPFVGIHQDGPADAAVIQPFFSSEKGVVIAHGICPRYSLYDPYAMAQCAFDEAVRNALAVGADPAQLYALDNFCWSNAHDKIRLGMLVQACKGLYDYAVLHGIPFVSGKDSMWNDFVYEKDGEKKILSVVPTLLITIVGLIDDVSKMASMDVKHAGDFVYLVGETKEDMGSSFFYLVNNGHGGTIPRPHSEALQWYRRLHDAREMVSSVHDCSEGGLAVALAESAFAGGFGMDLSAKGYLRSDTFLFSESTSRFVVTVSPQNHALFEQEMRSVPITYLGKTNNEKSFIINYNGQKIISSTITQLKMKWQTPW